MGKALGDFIGAIFMHIVFVLFLGVIGILIWNEGVVGLIYNASPISYQTSTAIMLGVYVLNMFVKIQITRAMAYKQQKYMIDKIIKFYRDNNN